MSGRADPFGNRDLHGDAPEARDPEIRFAFDFPELWEAFMPIDEAAGRARGNRLIGFLAIGFVLIALLLASGDPALAGLDAGIHERLGIAAASLGLVGTAIAVWSAAPLAPRRVWLRARMQAEEIRLFHFRYIADHFTATVASAGDKEKQTAYQKERAARFSPFRGRLIDEADKQLTALLSSPEHTPFEESTMLDRAADVSPSVAGKVIAAWRALRLERQLAYCDAKLAMHATEGRLSPRQVETFFSIGGWVAIIVIVVLHVVHFGGHLVHISRPAIEIGVTWTALIALAARALESGLAPQREVERYEQYRLDIRVAMQRLDAAPTIASKLETMRAFERTSLEEMLVFIRTQARAHFLL